MDIKTYLRPSFPILFFLTVCVVIFVSAYLRLDQINQIYDEYDDVGVIAIQKAQLQTVEVELNFGPIERVQFNKGYLQNIETTIWYGAFIGHVWTYAPGQYLLSSLLLSESLSARQRHIAVRSLSAAISVLTILLLVLFLARQCAPESGERWLILPITALLAFSTNTILYAMHASPYSFYGFALLAALVICDRTLKGRGHFGNACVMLSILCLFNYLVVLVLVPFLGLVLNDMIAGKRPSALSMFRNLSGWNLAQLLVILCSLAAMAVFLKVAAANPGVSFPTVHGYADLVTALHVLFTQFNEVAYSLLFGGIPHRWMASVLGFFTALVPLLLIRSWFLRRNYSALLSVVLLGGWIVAFILNKLPFEQSRHTLMLLPPFCLVLFWSARRFVSHVPMPVTMVASILVTIGMGVAGYSNAHEAFGPRKAVLTKQSVAVHDPDLVLTYGFTLGPLVDFHEDDVKVVNLDFQSANDFDWSAIDVDDRIILVSQTEPMTVTRLAGLQDRFPELFEKRTLLKLSEISTGVFFPFHSYPVSSNQNGAYLYLLSQ